MSIFSTASEIIAYNGDWDDVGFLEKLVNFNSILYVGASNLPDSKNSMTILDIEPGEYKAVVKGKNFEIGYALLEIYEIRQQLHPNI